MEPTDELLAAHHVLVRTDNAFQRTARLLQARWREHRGLPIGQHRGRPLGSRLAMPFAKETLANHMTETIRDVVRAEVLDPRKSAGKLYGEPRIFEDLLSSQPLCFNLFGELQRDRGLASRTFEELLAAPGLQVTAIEFEHSPGRGDPLLTGDHSAFDVFVAYVDGSGRTGFVGIEVKYAENLDVPAARHRRRYEEVADAMGVFLPDARQRLREPPLEQFWRDHLLAGALLLAPSSGLTTGRFAVLYPEGNAIVGAAVAEYRACLTDAEAVAAWTLEDVLDAIERAGASGWVGEVRRRYITGE